MKEHYVRIYYPEAVNSEIFELARKYKFTSVGYPLCGSNIGHNQRFTFKEPDLASKFIEDVNLLVRAVEETDH